MEKYMLLSFFHELIKLGIDMPGRPDFGSPISRLLGQMCLYQETFLSHILGDYTGESHEVRLNDAGLKMYWRAEKSETKTSGTIRRFTCRIGGDQAKDYVGFVVAANKLIKQYNYERR
jgi:hypothetical protein